MNNVKQPTNLKTAIRYLKFSVLIGILICGSISLIFLINPNINNIIINFINPRHYSLFKRAASHLRFLYMQEILFSKQIEPRFADLDELMQVENPRVIGESHAIYYKEGKRTHVEVYQSGYYFCIYLSQKPEETRKYFCIFAWPAHNKNEPSGFIDHNNKIYITYNKNYLGPNKGPKPEDIYTGERFKSPINTEKWKPLD